jgi:hypothetical protein
MARESAEKTRGVQWRPREERAQDWRRGNMMKARTEIFWLIGAIVATLALFGVLQVAFGATITVNPGGSIATGIATAAAGDTVVVNAGAYTGGIVISKSVAVMANGVVVLTPATFRTGEAISVRCNSCAVIGFMFEDFEGGVSPDVQTHSNVTIQGNVFRRGGSGIWIAGTAWLVEGNEIDGLPLSARAEDYANVFGTGHIVRHNYFHGLRIPQDLGSGPDYKHNDAIQFWNNNGEVLRDLLIEENIFTDFVQGVFLANETGVLPSMGNITIRNNVFWGTNFIQSGNLLGKPSHGLFVGKAAIPGVVTTNNLFHNCANSVSLYNMPAATVVQGNIIEQYNTAYALSNSGQPTRGTGNVLWTTVQGAWEGGIATLLPDKRLDPMLGASLLGADGLPWTADDGWRARNALAAGYGPQIGSLSPPPPAPVPSPDTVPPVVVVLGANPFTLSVGTVFADPGATATDDRDAVVTVLVSGTVNTAAAGSYLRSYTARDVAGNSATKTRSVNVEAVPLPAPAPTLEQRVTALEEKMKKSDAWQARWPFRAGVRGAGTSGTKYVPSEN